MPEIESDPLYRMREGTSQRFNELMAAGADVDLANAHLRSVELRGADLEGASIHSVKVGGKLFPENRSAHELRLSVELGTQMPASI